MSRPARHRSWIVVPVVAAVFAVEVGAGVLAQQGHRHAPASAQASTAYVASASAEPTPSPAAPPTQSAGAPTPSPTPTSCPTLIQAGSFRIVAKAGHCVTVGDVRAAGCSVPTDQPDSAPPGSFFCQSVHRARGPASSQPLPSRPPLPTAIPSDPGLPAAKDPVVARLVAWDDDDAQCVSFVHGRTPDQVVRLMGGDPAKQVTADAVPSESDDNYVAGVGVRSGWTVMSGWNGYSCNDPHLLEKLTAGGATAVTVYWNGDIGSAMFSYAVDGRLLTAWDQPDAQTDGTQPHALDKLEARVSADVAAGRIDSPMMAMAASLTGIVLPYDWKPSWWVRMPNS